MWEWSATMTLQVLPDDDSTAIALKEAIQTGDLVRLEQLLVAQPGLARVRLCSKKGASRTLLHVATDWPGYFPNGPAIVEILVAAGANPNSPILNGRHAETPLHWAASSDDVEVAAALIDGGADIEALGASIAGGTPLDDAVGYGCWRVARLLVDRGAQVPKLWQAAGLGMLARVEQLLTAPNRPTAVDINDAFWQACAGGHRRTAEYLLAHGADLNWTPAYTKKSPLEITSSLDTGRKALLDWLREKGATTASGPV
jgi:ankyrin repeat protein